MQDVSIAFRFVLFLSLCVSVCSSVCFAEINYIALGPPFTTYTYWNRVNGDEQGGDPALAYDNDFETYYGSPYSSGDGAATHGLFFQAEFAEPVDLNRIAYRMAATVGGYSDYEKHYSWSMKVEYKMGGTWNILPGSSFSGSGDGNIVTGYDTGIVEFSVPIANVEGLRATIDGWSYYTGGGSYYYTHAFLYELQGWGDPPSPTPTPTPLPVPTTSPAGSVLLMLGISLLIGIAGHRRQ